MASSLPGSANPKSALRMKRLPPFSGFAIPGKLGFH